MSSREDIEWWERAYGVNQKLGSLCKMPPDMLRTLNQCDGSNCLPLYRHSLASGMLSCYTEVGQPRHLEVFEGYLFQQTD
jgi:hypothetical protein